MEDANRQERRSAIRKLFIIFMFGPILFTILLMYLPTEIVGLVSFVILAAISYRYLRVIFGLNRSFNDSFAAASKSAASSAQLYAFVALGLGAYFVFLIIAAVLRFFELGDSLLAFIITLILTVLVIRITDTYAGKNIEMGVNYREKSHKRYVDSLGKVEGKCMSCQKSIDVEDKICPFCGFKQKEISKDSSYIPK